VSEKLLKRVHFGARLSNDLEFSDRTHRLDTAAKRIGPARVERDAETNS